jgi:hypothetical protein
MAMRPECPTGSITPRVTNTTWQAVSVTGAPTHAIATFKGNCPTSRQGVAGQTFVPKCPSGSVTHTRAGWEGACPTSEKAP